MTKVIVLGQEPKEEKKLKPIEFVKYLCDDTGRIKVHTKEHKKPSQWDNIELICLRYDGKYDLMFGFNYNRTNGCLYLGYFNDGVVE